MYKISIPSSSSPIIPLALSILLLGAAVYAADDTASGGAGKNASETSAQDTSSSAQSTAPSSKVLKGSLEETQLSLQELRDAGISIKRVRERASDLNDEVTRQPVTVSYSPNVIGSTVIMTPTAHLGTGAYLPPRKKWMKYCMDDIRPIVSQMKADVDEAIESGHKPSVPPEVQAQIEPVRQEAFKLIKQCYEHTTTLEHLTEHESYNNGAIATAATALGNDMKKLEQCRKNILKAYQKEAQRRKALSKNGGKSK